MPEAHGEPESGSRDVSLSITPCYGCFYRFRHLGFDVDDRLHEETSIASETLNSRHCPVIIRAKCKKSLLQQ